jgi:hypothetical protein
MVVVVDLIDRDFWSERKLLLLPFFFNAPSAYPQRWRMSQMVCKDLDLPQAMHLYIDGFVLLVDLVLPIASRSSCFPASDDFDIALTVFL